MRLDNRSSAQKKPYHPALTKEFNVKLTSQDWVLVILGLIAYFPTLYLIGTTEATIFGLLFIGSILTWYSNKIKTIISNGNYIIIRKRGFEFFAVLAMSVGSDSNDQEEIQYDVNAVELIDSGYNIYLRLSKIKFLVASNSNRHAFKHFWESIQASTSESQPPNASPA
jgi:hypothetical protein